MDVGLIFRLYQSCILFIYSLSILIQYKLVHQMRPSMTPVEIRYLSLVAISGAVGLADIRRGLKIHPVTATRLSSSLKGKGFIMITKEGLSKRISISESKHAQLFRKMVLEYRHIPFHKLLSGPGLEVLSAISFFAKTSSRKEISKISQVSEASTARSLEKLKRAGILQKKGLYFISPRFQTLNEFVQEYRRYLNQKAAQAFSNDAVIVWERNNEFIVESSQKEEEEDGFRLTGPSAFARFGVKLLMTVSHYYHSLANRQLQLEDLIIHTLLLPQSQRNVLAMLLVWKKNKDVLRTSYLLEQAEEYGMKRQVKEMADYLRTHGKELAPSLPPWGEFVSKAEEYGIRT
jgi:Mn-dependent DtxR family transcriptional regulator